MHLPGRLRVDLVLIHHSPSLVVPPHRVPPAQPRDGHARPKNLGPIALLPWADSRNAETGLHMTRTQATPHPNVSQFMYTGSPYIE